MGKFKESFSNLYYNSKEDFFTAVESGENEPTYVGLLEIVRVLKLINRRNKKRDESHSHSNSPHTQLRFNENELDPFAIGAS